MKDLYAWQKFEWNRNNKEKVRSVWYNNKITRSMLIANLQFGHWILTYLWTTFPSVVSKISQIYVFLLSAFSLYTSQIILWIAYTVKSFSKTNILSCVIYFEKLKLQSFCVFEEMGKLIVRHFVTATLPIKPIWSAHT